MKLRPLENQFESYAQRSDQELVSLIVEGDETALAFLLLGKCGSRLKFLARRQSPPVLEFEELISELFIRLQHNNWKALRDFRGANISGGDCKLTTYISLIASRLLYRKSQSLKDFDRNAPLDEVEAVVGTSRHLGFSLAVEETLMPELRLERRDVCRRIMKAIQDLENPAERAVLLLYKIEGRSVHEVAQAMNTTVGNVYTRCSRALTKLESLLKKREETYE